MEFRFLLHGANSAAMNMAIDESIMQHARETGDATVRFYSWKPSAVSIGYFQGLEEEVDLQKCSEHGVDFVRRITGGGAVFHDKELTYSFVCTEKSGIVPEKIIDSYMQICKSVILGLKELGLAAAFVPLNDIVVGGKKVSGNAQTRRGGVVLQHGTILLKVDVDKMFSLLRVPSEKMRDKIVSDVKQRVTSVEEQLGRRVEFGEMSDALKKGFEKAFDAGLVSGMLSRKEMLVAEKIAKEKFLAKEWNFKR